MTPMISNQPILADKVISNISKLRLLCRLGMAFAVFVIIVGAITRLTDSGLGCPDWPGCYGTIWIPEAEIAAAVAPNVPLEPFKAGMEMFHRYIASALGLMVIAAVYFGWKIRHQTPQIFRLTAWLLLAVSLQGAFGAWTVTWKLLPQIVTLHLLGGLTCLTLFMITASCCSGAIEQRPRFRQISRLGLATLCVLAIQITLGGWTSTNYAAVGCVGFPTCNGQWIPEMDFINGFDVMAPIGPDYLYGQLEPAARTAIHFSHRLGAIILGALLLAYWLQQRRHPLAKIRRLAHICLSIYTLQLVMGITLVSTGLPLTIAILHTAGAVLLLLALLHSIGAHQPTESSQTSQNNSLAKAALRPSPRQLITRNAQ